MFLVLKGYLYESFSSSLQNVLSAVRKTFDVFFLRYPYCYGYWKKYADIEKKHGDIQVAEEVNVNLQTCTHWFFFFFILAFSGRREHCCWRDVCVWSLKVYRRGLQAIPLSVDLWLHYLTFIKENSDHTDPETEGRIRAYVKNLIHHYFS